jgi:hypothetical protein
LHYPEWQQGKEKISAADDLELMPGAKGNELFPVVPAVMSENPVVL